MTQFMHSGQTTPDRKLSLLTCVAFIALCFVQISRASSQQTAINHYDKAFSPIFRVYLTEILKTVLDKSSSEYGPYRLNFYSKNLSTNRSKLETEKGVLLDILFASHWNGKYVNPNNVIAVELPVFRGMLGLRSLIVTETIDSDLTRVETAIDFKQYSAGQGANWEDVQILRSNNIVVSEAHSFDALLPMLAKRRYDYLPLSSLEVQTTLRTKGIAFSTLSANQHISIFYPMPFYIFVNSKRPELAERLSRGIEIAKNDGTLDGLFERHFGFMKQDFEQNIKKLILLKNPLIDEEQNTRFTEQFLAQYQQFFDILQ